MSFDEKQLCIDRIHLPRDIRSEFMGYLLTLMLLVATLANTKWCKNPGKLLKLGQMGTHLRVLSESFPMNTNMTGFGWFSRIFASLCLGRK